MADNTVATPVYPGFTWADHASRIDARSRVIASLNALSAMELPQAAWDQLEDVVGQVIAAGRASPDVARDAWLKAQEQ